MNETENEKRPAPGRRRLWAPATAAAAILLAAAAYLLWPAGAPPRPADFYEPFPMYLNAGPGEADKPLETAIADYRAGNYAAAMPVFQDLVTGTVDNAPYHLYAGICQMELGHPIEASIHLEEAATREDARFSPPAEWYLALAYLRQDGKGDMARFWLEKIVREEGDYAKQAEQLLREAPHQ